MKRNEVTSLQAEKAELLRLIDRTPAKKVLDLGTLRTRLQMVEELLATQSDKKLPARVKLTFSGKPVISSHGIMADFGMAAVNAFSEAVSAVAASLTAPLKLMGPIPNRGQNQLLITNTARGSFGFELEELPPKQLALEEPSIVEQALEKTQALLQATIQPDDEALADVASEIDQRAVAKVRSFIQTLFDNEALCALGFNDREFRFLNAGQVKRSLERMSEGNLHEESKDLTGQFEGVLPKRRSFEFRDSVSREVVAGKIGPGVINPEHINDHLKETVAIKVMVTRVGQGRPRYLLIEVPAWASGGAPADW